VIVLSVSHVKKSFGTESVLKDVSLTLAQRERMGLVGVNGSGKTTLLRILAGQLNADEGAVAMQKGMVVGYLAQSYMPETGSTVLDEMEAIFTPIYQNGGAPAGDRRADGCVGRGCLKQAWG
jgi:ATP-binding cassette subfamily F protein 3